MNSEPNNLLTGESPSARPVGSASPNQDRKDRVEMVLAKAQRLGGDEAAQAWGRLCRELGNMAHPEARMPRFNGLLHACWIAASNDQT
jgi:hypothetical protein